MSASPRRLNGGERAFLASLEFQLEVDLITSGVVRNIEGWIAITNPGRVIDEWCAEDIKSHVYTSVIAAWQHFGISFSEVWDTPQDIKGFWNQPIEQGGKQYTLRSVVKSTAFLSVLENGE
jgi:hypothetical protein